MDTNKEIENNFFISGYTLGDVSEIDEEDIELKREAGVYAYDGYNFIDAFDDPNFESIFYLTYELIKEFSLNDLRIICRDLIDLVFKKFEYQIVPTPVFGTFGDVDEFLDFIKFLKFDNVSFLFDLITDMNLDIKKVVELKDLNSLGHLRIINHIEHISFKYKYNKYIYNYIISHAKKPFIKWINQIFIDNKSDVLLELI